MLTQLSLITLSLALVTAIPIDLLDHSIPPTLPCVIHPHTHSTRDNVIKEAVAGVYICTGEHWSGKCYWEETGPYGYCHKYDLGRSSSFGPDGNVNCALFSNDKCEGTAVQALGFPGVATGLKGDIKSWMCHY